MKTNFSVLIPANFSLSNSKDLKQRQKKLIEEKVTPISKLVENAFKGTTYKPKYRERILNLKKDEINKLKQIERNKLFLQIGIENIVQDDDAIQNQIINKSDDEFENQYNLPPEFIEEVKQTLNPQEFKLNQCILFYKTLSKKFKSKNGKNQLDQENVEKFITEIYQDKLSQEEIQQQFEIQENEQYLIDLDEDEINFNKKKQLNSSDKIQQSSQSKILQKQITFQEDNMFENQQSNYKQNNYNTNKILNDSINNEIEISSEDEIKYLKKQNDQEIINQKQTLEQLKQELQQQQFQKQQESDSDQDNFNYCYDILGSNAEQEEKQFRFEIQQTLNTARFKEQQIQEEDAKQNQNKIEDEKNNEFHQNKMQNLNINSEELDNQTFFSEGNSYKNFIQSSQNTPKQPTVQQKNIVLQKHQGQLQQISDQSQKEQNINQNDNIIIKKNQQQQKSKNKFEEEDQINNQDQEEVDEGEPILDDLYYTALSNVDILIRKAQISKDTDKKQQLQSYLQCKKQIMLLQAENQNAKNYQTKQGLIVSLLNVMKQYKIQM